MRAQVASLCDAATVRDGLLHILGGGVAKVGRSEYPSSLNLGLALALRFEPEEAGSHELQIRMLDEAGNDLGLIGAEIQVKANDPEDKDLPITAAAAVPIGSFPMTEPGLYRIEILVDGQALEELIFRAVEIPAPADL